MKRTATVVAPLAVVFFFCGCGAPAKKPAPILAEGALVPSPRLIIGRVIAIDATRGTAVVELAIDAPAAAAAEGSELIARTLDLQETARLRATRQLRGRILGAQVTGGQPAAGDEVVWVAP
ncbi:MAG: hypothetical protein JNL39_16935 [Opitutaceae bacterium]|nr:hypothetical protein [Opitutaceae bacterium]